MVVMDFYRLSLLLISALVVSNSAVAQPNGSSIAQNKCVNRLRRDPRHFEPGRNSPIFVFLSEPPFIVLDPKMTSEDDVKLFHCKDRKMTFPRLHGIFFDILDNLPYEEYFCVFGGPSCTFDEMINFVAHEQQHHFIVGGALFNLPHRITSRTRASTPISSEMIVLIGRRDSGTILAEAFSTILRPFQLKTWMLLLGVVIFFIIVRLWLAIYFATPRTVQGIARHLLGDFELDEEALFDYKPKKKENIRLLNRSAVRCWDRGAAAFFVIVVLFYEISVVNFLFLKKTEAIEQPLAALGPRELREYVIKQGGGAEIVWRKHVDPEMKYEHSNPPWHWCKGPDDCYDKILDDTHPAKFAVSMESSARYQLGKRKACSKLTVYKTATPFHTFDIGLFYGPRVRRSTKVLIDRGILRLRYEGEMRNFINRLNAVPLDCGSPSTGIPPEILGWLLLTALGGCVLFVFVAVIVAIIIRRQQ